MKDCVTMAHGSGGLAYRELVQEVFLPAFSNNYLAAMTDSAVCPAASRIAMTTDSYVIKPLFFPGGDIGRLAVSGTVNDLAVSGAVPQYLTAGMVIEAGFPMNDLKRIVQSMAQTAKEANVTIVTGDTKVVEKNACDGIFINTAGVGLFFDGKPIPPQKVEPGDAIIASGFLGSHGTAIMAARADMGFQPPLCSDVRPMADAVQTVLQADVQVHAMRDPTRGGLAATLCEWAHPAVDILLEEESVPVRQDVRSVCELLGLDPFYCANEGVVLFCMPQEQAQQAVQALHRIPHCASASVIARVVSGSGSVIVHTPIGTRRKLLVPTGEQLPRIC